MKPFEAFALPKNTAEGIREQLLRFKTTSRNDLITLSEKAQNFNFRAFSLAAPISWTEQCFNPITISNSKANPIFLLTGDYLILVQPNETNVTTHYLNTRGNNIKINLLPTEIWNMLPYAAVQKLMAYNML
ncbi:hypothetical protein [Dyadobacter fermentans]|uniref:hypothetical protein n=1 Tax=Dyadobacter fermentans TaxID=94254 RepID=UPI001CC0CDDB|nr:hypothetical protein [Dyadobacter fermentans]MBZ1363035.1 hypothetical protein [Dyadobacter fermentans]